jgi:hypothetical protein
MCVSLAASSAADPEDLAISFQVLETARVIYSRHYDGPGRVVEESAEEAEKKAAAAAAAAGEEEEKESSRPAAAAAAAAAVPAAAAAAPAAAAAAPAAAAGSDAAPYTMSQKDIGLALALTYEILAQWFLEKGQTNYSVRSLRVGNQRLESHAFFSFSFVACVFVVAMSVLSDFPVTLQRTSRRPTARTRRPWRCRCPGWSLTRAI